MNLLFPFKQKENQNTKTKSIQFTVLIDKQKKADMNKHPVKHRKKGAKMKNTAYQYKKNPQARQSIKYDKSFAI